MFRAIPSLVVMALLLTGAVQAETIIPGGNVSGTWTQSESPYVVIGNITVPNYDSLKIAPGVLVKFNPNVTLTVMGKLYATGTQSDSVFFTRSQTSNWGGISVQNADDTVKFSFCALEYGSGISFNYEYEPLRMTDCRMSMPFTGGGDCMLFLTRCLATGEIFAFGWDAHIDTASFINCAFGGDFNCPFFSYSLNFDSCNVGGNIDYDSIGRIWMNNSILHGNFTGIAIDPWCRGYFNNSIIYGKMTNRDDMFIDHCTIYDSLISLEAYEEETSSLHVSNGSILLGPVQLIHATATITGSTISKSIQSSPGDGLNISGCTISDSIYGSVGGAIGGVDLYNNTFNGGSVRLSGWMGGFHLNSNLFINSPVSAIRLVNTSWENYTLGLANNTIYGAAGHGIILSEQNPSGSHQVILSNNLISCCAGYGVVNEALDTVKVIYSDAWNNTLGNYFGVTPGAGAISVDPLFVNPDSGDFHLQSTVGSYHNGQWWPDPGYSPCIDAGDPATSYTLEPMPNGNRADIGNYGGTSEASLSNLQCIIGSGQWTLENSPYLIAGEVLIPPDSTLIIQSGVEVIFQGRFALTIKGHLQALGTPGQPITFTASDTCVGWRGLRFEDAPEGSRLAYCNISHSWATGNSPDNQGGAIYCLNTDLTMDHCFLSWNRANNSGGAVYGQSSELQISFCSMDYNKAVEQGGAIYLKDSQATIENCNFICDSVTAAYSLGGAVYSSGTNYEIRDSRFLNNTAIYRGGGVAALGNCHLIISGTVFSDNHGISGGGGMQISASHASILNTTFTYNYGVGGGAIRVSSATVTANNCIFWGNYLYQLSVSSGSVTRINYSDLQGGWAGVGNIALNPAFVDTLWADYRLAWGSPCIDTGDPALTDPDNTRSDMGAFYFDQSRPVRVLLTPHGQPIQIPPTGGSFDFDLRLTNIDTSPQTTTAWGNVTLPSGNIYGPMLGPVQVAVQPGATLSRLRSQVVPGSAPAGLYHYNAYAAVAGDTSKDSFMFGKLGDSGQAGMTTGWANTGADFAVERTADQNLLPFSFCLLPSSPNPFNPATVIRYQMADDRQVSLRVYDISGRLVTTLVDSRQKAGQHNVIFNGSGLASGLYFVRMQTAEYAVVQKIVLLK